MFPATSTADSVTVEVGGTKYDVSTVTTTFAADATQLEQQPWSGSVFLADEFAVDVGLALGFPNLIQLTPGVNTASGPLFDYGTSAAPYAVITALYPSGIAAVVGPGLSGTETYAVVTPVATPEPGTLSLLFSGLLFVGLLVRVSRRRESRLATDW
jgi:hypothetical protein